MLTNVTKRKKRRETNNYTKMCLAYLWILLTPPQPPPSGKDKESLSINVTHQPNGIDYSKEMEEKEFFPTSVRLWDRA